MSSKQDRQGVRTATDLERKYGFGKSFAEIMEIATDARNMAEKAEEGIDGLDHDEIFNLLTKDGTLQGLYRGEDGDLYINASYIKAGIIKSPDGESLVINLDEGTIDATGALRTVMEYWDGGHAFVEIEGGHINLASVGDNGYRSDLSIHADYDGVGIDSTTGFNHYLIGDRIIPADIDPSAYADGCIDSIFSQMSNNSTRTIVFSLNQSTMNGHSGVWFVTIKKESEGNGFVIAQKQDYLKLVSMTKAMTNFLWGNWVVEGSQFAPSGHGLGGQGVHITDCNSLYKSGFYRFDEGANFPFSYGTLLVSGRYSNNANQIAIGNAGSNGGTLAFRHNNNAWQFVNPLMTAGTEYRIAERWKGKAVYAKHIAQTLDVIGDASSYKDEYIPHGISDFKNLVRVEANFNAQFNLPYMGANGDWYGIVEVDSTNIKLRCYKGTWTRPTLNATVYYTKE